MIEQTKWAVQKLLASGLKRSEFRVRCETKMILDPYAGRRYRQYGDAHVSLRCSKARALSLIDSFIANGLGVFVLRVDGVPNIVLIETSYKQNGKVRYSDYKTDPETGSWEAA